MYDVLQPNNRLSTQLVHQATLLWVVVKTARKADCAVNIGRYVFSLY